MNQKYTNIQKMLFTLMIFITILKSQAIDITKDAFGTKNNYLPAAFGDFNSDKLTDIFVIKKYENETYAVEILLSNSKPPYFESKELLCFFNKRKVKSVVPSDFDGDGAMDILVLTMESTSYDAHIIYGDLKSMACINSEAIVASFKSQPLLMDYNGDMIADLFGEGLDGNRSFWIFNKQRSKPIEVKMKIPVEEKSLPLLRAEGGHGFVDLDDDLVADLWIATEDNFEFWPSSLKFESKLDIEYPKKANHALTVIGQTAFMDIDLDGSMEVLLPVCSDESCTESYLYICEFTNATEEWFDLKVNFKDEKDVIWSLPSNTASYLYTNTKTPRVGDINLDGYPDILITLFDKKIPQVFLFLNSPCVDCKYSRTFIAQWNTFNEYPYSVLGTFFDFEEDGSVDVLLVNSSSSGDKYSMTAYKDTSAYDAMFIKILVMTGQCYENCIHKTIPYGTNQPGPSVLYSITSSEGFQQKSCATQLTQSSHFALQLPFTILGLGRNWNFVDTLQIGIPGMHSYNKSLIDHVPEVLRAKFTQIIPNSQLKVIPYPIDKPSQWITKLFITPSTAMLMTAGSLIATCLFVAAIIGFLHYKEKQQDKREKREGAQSFHFDAM